MKTLSRNIVAIIALTLSCQSLFAQGGQLAPGVDLNADGQAELLSASGSSGTVTVLDGATHAAIRIIAAPVADSGFGSAVTWLPDVNNDGISDLAVLAPWTTTSTSWGTVYIHSLATGALLSTTDSPATRHLGVAMKLVADQDSDSIPDLLVELQATGTQSKSILISSRTGTILTELPGTVSEMLSYVAQGGKLYAQSDIDGSGTVDLLDVAGFTGLVTAEDPRADLNHDGVIDTDDTLVMIGDSSHGIVTIAAQGFVSGQQGGVPPENCLCSNLPASNTESCDNASVVISAPSGVRVGEPFLLTVTGMPAGGILCAEIYQGNGLILDASQSPISMVLFDNSQVCVRVKYTVMVNGEECSKCDTMCVAADLICPQYTISLRCPTFSDLCPVMVSANALNTVLAVVDPEGSAVYWEIDDPLGLVEWYREYPTELKFRTKNLPGVFTVQARYGIENGPCPPGYADCVITVDPDTDGDGLSDSWENAHCTDPNERDSDGDDVWDGAEIAMGTDPCLASSTPAMVDSDNDGLTDIEEYQIYHTDPHLFDTDGDNVQDYAEVELARLGNFPDMDPLRAYSLAEGNTSLAHAFDGWQASYYLAYDKDRDGLFDPWELAMGLDPTQVDQDGDGIGDGWEMRPRPLPQLSFGGPRYVPARSAFFAEDGIRGGESDADGDWDGLSNAQEEWLGTDAFNADSDGDGVLDGDESRLGLNPSRGSSSGDFTSDGAGDIDGDGLSNGNESNNGGLIDDADTDGDGVSDGVEVAQGSMADNSDDEGTPRSELEANDDFARVQIAATAFNGYYSLYGQCGHYFCCTGPLTWSIRHSGGGALVRVGPCTVRAVGVVFDGQAIQHSERTVFLKRGKRYSFSASNRPESGEEELCQSNVNLEPVHWKRGARGNSSSTTNISAPGGLFAPRGSANTEVPRNQLGYDSMGWWHPNLDHFGTRGWVTSYDTGPNGYSTGRVGPIMNYQGDLYLPKVEFFDLRHWQPALKSADEARAHALATGEDFYTYSSGDGPKYLKLPPISAGECTPARRVDGAVTDGVSGCVVKIGPLPKSSPGEGPFAIRATNTYGFSMNEWEPDVVGEFLVPDPSGWLPSLPLRVPETPFGTTICDGANDCLDWNTAHHAWSARRSAIGNDGIGLYFPPANFLDANAVASGNHLGSEESATLKVWIAWNSIQSGGWKNIGEFKLRRPPVVLVHGILSGPSTWGSMWTSTAAKTRLYYVDYGPTSHLGYPENVVHLQPVIDRAINELRTGQLQEPPYTTFDISKFAATQVDLVGHSQGGQLIRWYVGNTDAGADALAQTDPTMWESESLGIMRRHNGWPSFVIRRSMDKNDPLRRNCRVDNYFAGDVRRFVTIGSPFLGSPLASTLEPVLRPGFENELRLISLFRGGPPITFETLKGVEASIGEGAWREFGTRIFVRTNGRLTYVPPTCASDLQTGILSRARSVLSASQYQVGARDNLYVEQASPAWFPIVGTMCSNNPVLDYPHVLVNLQVAIGTFPGHHIGLPLNEQYPTLLESVGRLNPRWSDLIVEAGSQANDRFLIPSMTFPILSVLRPTVVCDRVTHMGSSWVTNGETSSEEIRDVILRHLRLREVEFSANGSYLHRLFYRGGLQ